MDTAALIATARMWRSPEHRDQAEIRLDELLCKGLDAIEEIRFDESYFNPPRAYLVITLSSEVVVSVPCDL